MNNGICVMVLFMLTMGVIAEDERALCKLLGSPVLPLLSKKGDITIGGANYCIFQLQTNIFNCKTLFYRISFREFQFAQTMMFAIEEINNSSSLLPNVSVGYKIFDSCGSTLPSTRAAMGLINGQEKTFEKTCTGQSTVHAIVGASKSSSTIVLSQIAGIFQIPVISHFSTCACLSNRKEHPSFFRTIPSDYYQSRALAQLVKYFGWTWVGAVRSDNDYGNNGMATFIEAATKEGICVEYSEAISGSSLYEQVERVVRVIKTGTAKVLVAFLDSDGMDILLEEALRQNLTGLQWVGSESWITAHHLATMKYSGILYGSIGFAIKKAKIAGLQDFLLQVHPSQDPQNHILKEFWEETFGCSFQSSLQETKQCSGSERLRDIKNPFTDVSELRISNNVYKAVYAVAHAMHSMLKCGENSGAVNASCTLKSILQPKEVVKHIQDVNFSLKSGEKVYFDERGDPAATYQLVNWQRNPAGDIVFVVVGSYDASLQSGKEFTMNGLNVTWRPVSVCSESCPSGFRQAMIKGKPICCFSCITCAAGEISNSTNTAKCSPCPLGYWSNEDHNKCVPKVLDGSNARSVVCFLLLPLAILLDFVLCSLTFIGRPTVWSCMLRHVAFGIAFALCISCILTKTITVVIAFKARTPGNRVPQCLASHQRMGVVGGTFLQVLVCVAWLAQAPPFPHKNTIYALERIILECNLGSSIGFWVVLGYIGLLAVLCLILAFLARKLPDNFNEAKFITFSMLIFSAVWVTFIPAYVSSPGKFTVAVEIFAILASSFGLLFCIFAPKCYILLLKPERNTKNHIMGRDLQKNN
uniref:Olfactory receptor C family, h1 n=1 Tax=Oryzias latipes TaxID=8090 RepID=A0A3P9LT30_ORYLA